MKNTRRLQAKVQHMALVSIIIAGIVAPVTQLTPVFPGMSLQDVKAATTGTPDAVDKAGVIVENVRDQGQGVLPSNTPAQLAGQSGTMDSSWKISPLLPEQQANKIVNAKGDFRIQYASKTTEGNNTIYDGSQKSNNDSDKTSVTLTTPSVPQNTVPGQTASYMSVTPGSWDSGTGISQAYIVAAGNKMPDGTGSTNSVPAFPDLTKLYRFSGKQYVYLHNPADTTGTMLTNISTQLRSGVAGMGVVVQFADGTMSDASTPTRIVGSYTGALRYYSLNLTTGIIQVQVGHILSTSTSRVTNLSWDAPVDAEKDEHWTNNNNKPASVIVVKQLKDVAALNWQLVLAGNVKLPSNGDTTQVSGDVRMFGAGGSTASLTYGVSGNATTTPTMVGSAIAYMSSYQEGGFNLLKNKTTDKGTITHDESYTDADGKSVTTGSYTGSQLVQLDKFTNTQSSDTTGTYTIDTGSSSVGFASDAIVLQNKNGDDVSAAVNMSGVTYKDATGATVTDSSKAKTATFTATLPAGASFTVKSKLVANAGQPAGVTSTTTMAGKDANGDAVNLAGTFNWVPVTTVSGNITYVDATGATIATGKYTDKQPGSSTSDITAPTTTDGYRYKFVSADKATYDGSDIKVTVAKIATGNINYVYNGKTVSSTPFTDQEAGKTIANIAAPAGTVDGLRYKLADATKSYAYPDKDGDVNVDLAAIVSGTIKFVDADNNTLVKQQEFLDQTPGAQISPLTLPDGYVLAVDANGDVQSTYNYPTTDAQVVTVKVQKLTTGNRNDGMELTEVPSFSSDNNTIGASDTTTLTATKDGVLSYLNLKGQKADIYMSATDLKSNGSALPIKTLKANLSAGLADVYAANQTDGYGHMIVNDTTSKKGSLTIPDLQMTLSNNNFAAGTYSGTINYTMVSDDLN